MKMLLICLIISMVVRVHAFSRGAPAGVCGTMIPGHTPNTPQSAASPYSLQTNMVQSGTNVTVQVTIWSPLIYKGFLLVGRNQGSSANEFTGMFSSLPAGTQGRCGGQNLQGVTHTNSNAKSNMTFQWDAPSTYCGNITFRATVVWNFTTFWTGIDSNNLSIPCTGGRTMLTSTMATQSTMTPRSTMAPGTRSNSDKINTLPMLQLLVYVAMGFSLIYAMNN